MVSRPMVLVGRSTIILAMMIIRIWSTRLVWRCRWRVVSAIVMVLRLVLGTRSTRSSRV